MILRFWTMLALGAVLINACTLGRGGVADAQGVPTTVNITPDATGPRINPGVFGSNLEWESQGDGSLVNVQNPSSPWLAGLLPAIVNAGITSLRFPGGDLANTYRWKNGIGPPTMRPAGISYSGAPAPSLFGSDELLRLCRQSGTTPVITVNVAAGAQEAADWVEYLNGGHDTKWGAQRAANGNLAPAKVVYWEIGNELFSPTQPGHLSATAYGLALKNFAKAMKARDPSIKIGADLEASFQQAAWMNSVYPDLMTWNREVLSVAGKDIDFVSLHFYAPYDTLFGAEALSQLVWAGTDVFAQTLNGIKQLLQTYSTNNVEIGVLEYNTFYGRKTPDLRTASTDAALFNAMLLMRYMADPRITLANHWSLLNNNVFGMMGTHDGQLQSRPQYAIFQQLKPFASGRALPLIVNGPTYTVDAKGNVPAMTGVQAIQAFAGRDQQQHLRIALVNRSFATLPNVTLSFSDGHVTDVVAQSWTPRADKLSWNPPQTISLMHKARNLQFALPPQSFTVITGS